MTRVPSSSQELLLLVGVMSLLFMIPALFRPTNFPYEGKLVLRDHPKCHQKVVFQKRWSLVAVILGAKWDNYHGKMVSHHRLVALHFKWNLNTKYKFTMGRVGIPCFYKILLYSNTANMEITWEILNSDHVCSKN